MILRRLQGYESKYGLLRQHRPRQCWHSQQLVAPESKLRVTGKEVLYE